MGRTLCYIERRKKLLEIIELNLDLPVKNEHQVNEKIKSRQVRLVREDGDQIGVFLTSDAIHRARNEGLDLVVVNEKADPPVCKIVDYGKFKFDLSKKEKELAKKARESKVVLKEIQMRLVTDKNDVAIKSRKVREFLAEGNKVKIIVKFKGREATHPELGFELMKTVMELVGDCRIEKPSAMNGRDMVTIVAPAPAAN